MNGSSGTFGPFETDPYREWDAAYVLGALGPKDRRTFEDHLTTCGTCRASVTDLAGMPGLLGMLTPEHATALVAAGSADPSGEAGPPSDGVGEVVPLTALAAGARHRRARRRGLLVAAGVALVVGGGAAGVALTGPAREGPSAAVATTTPPSGAPSDPPPTSPQTPPLTTTVELLPVDGTDVRAELVLTPAAWGTRLDWSCSYPAGAATKGARYELVLVDVGGTREVVATWSATDAGRSDGLGASSAVPVDGISRLELGVVGLDRPLAAADVSPVT
ncbi:zf-HC2 domain-containing protein [Cellulosimicrobium sp. PMB13]|uniref:zf-HC2 domain-containing protein n=1 Tax=Cellulosimicrobium sp. PMB13 TaxID=3120158 RepID=UPI003F4CAAF9